MHRRARAALFLFGLGIASLALAADEKAAAKPRESSGKTDVAACADCHDEAKLFGRNVHSRLPALTRKGITGDALCATCHGDAAGHLDSSGETPVARPMGGRDGAEFCLSCHAATTSHASFRNSVHANTAAVNCLSCHSIHQADRSSPHLLAQASVALCASCHPGQASSLRDKPFTHRLRGGMECASCHDPHGRRGDNALKRTRADELPCVSCHAEKRGPFVFSHVTGVAGDCMSCHEPHGSSNPKQLIRARVDQLCLECHSTLNASTLGSQPPSFHNIRLPRYQNCTTCHVAVHGSNRSPALLK